jgi:DNA-binding XRE family transcriptional regulator
LLRRMVCFYSGVDMSDFTCIHTNADQIPSYVFHHMYEEDDTLPKINKEAAVKLRKQGGAYLKKLRNSAGMTQRDLADVSGFKYYTFISQIENGTGRIPAKQYEAYAKAVGVNLADFTKDMLKFYDPHTYKCLFGPASKKK